MKRLRNLLFGSFLAFMIWGCQQDDQLTPTEASFHFLESKFSLENFDDPFIKENLKVDWDNYTIRPDSLSNALIYQFDTSIKGKLVNDEKQFAYKYQVLGHNQGTEWNFEVIKILANNAAPVKHVTHMDLGEFSGTIHHYDLKGSNSKALAYVKGELISEMTVVDGKDPMAQSKEPSVANNGVWVLITVESYTDWYFDRGGNYEYAYSVHNSTQHEWAFIETGGTHGSYGHEQGDVYHGHHGGPSAPGNPEDVHDVENIFEEEEVLDELAPDTPIEDIEEFLSCYDTSQPAVITIYADQPIKGSSASINSGLDVGHVFISIAQSGKTSSFGFYPSGEGIKSAHGSSIIGNNGGDSYDVSLSRNISGVTLALVIEKAINYPDIYDVYNYNCTDYSLELANLAGFNIDNAWGVYPTGSGGDNPGKLGQILRTRPGANTEGGFAPSKANGCN